MKGRQFLRFFVIFFTCLHSFHAEPEVKLARFLRSLFHLVYHRKPCALTNMHRVMVQSSGIALMCVVTPCAAIVIVNKPILTANCTSHSFICCSPIETMLLRIFVVLVALVPLVLAVGNQTNPNKIQIDGAVCQLTMEWIPARPPAAPRRRWPNGITMWSLAIAAPSAMPAVAATTIASRPKRLLSEVSNAW